MRKTRSSRVTQAVKSPPKSSSAPSELDIAIAEFHRVEQDRKKLTLKDIQDFRKKFKKTCDTTKRETQILDKSQTKRAGTTRSGTKRGHVAQPVYSDGKWINKGIDDSQDKFDSEELEFLKRSIEKLKEVNQLKFEHLKYLVVDVFLTELKDIKSGKIESEFHNRYKALAGKSKTDLFSEVRTSLFTNEQRDYINGLLQGAFDTTTKDDNGDIKHSDINYVEIVMMAESTIRIVKYLHKFKSNEEAVKFMIRSSREAAGVGNDDY